MKILGSRSNQNEKLFAILMRELAGLVDDYTESLQDGWRLLVEMEDQDSAKSVGAFFNLDVQADQGGGDFAATKMNTLKLFPDMAGTGLDTPEGFADRVSNCGLLTGDQAQAFAKLRRKILLAPRSESLFGSINETLRQDCGLTTYRGGIRVPYTLISFTDGAAREVRGEIRIAFSGAKEWQDMCMACFVLRDLQQAIQKCWESVQVTYHLAGLQADQQYNMWLKLLGIRPV